MLSARVLKIFPALVAQALLGFALGYYLGGALPAAIVAVVAVIASFAVAVAARDPSEYVFRQLLLAATAMSLHMAALYAIGDAGTTPLIGANAQLLLTGFGLAACAWFAAHNRQRQAMTGPVDSRAAGTDDEDHTIEIDPAPAPLETIPRPGLRGPLALGVLSCALLIVATIFWLGDDRSRDALGGAVAHELPAHAPPVDAPVAVEEVQPVTTVAETDADAVPDDSRAAPAAKGSALPQNAVAPSAARRECMAQIESAHLFLQFARQSGTQEQYAQATQSQIARMLKAKPVGPRTLNRIAERMWEARDAEARSSTWWSSQFTRCESARSSGSWYVVRG